MDRDVYLILIGAGISLASSIATLILQFLLSQWSEKLRLRREEKNRQSKEIRATLMDKSISNIDSIRRRMEIMEERTKSSSYLALTVNWTTAKDIIFTFSLLRTLRGKERMELLARTIRQPWVWITVGTGVLVFIAWIGIVVR